MTEVAGRDVVPGKPIQIHDPTLRDGHHAVRHNLGADQLRAYARAADAARVPVVEVGHGNGLGASSLQVGRAQWRSIGADGTGPARAGRGAPAEAAHRPPVTSMEP